MSHGSASPSKPIVNFEEDGRLSEAACVRPSATTNSTRRHRNEPLLRLLAPSAMLAKRRFGLRTKRRVGKGGATADGIARKFHGKQFEESLLVDGFPIAQLVAA